MLSARCDVCGEDHLLTSVRTMSVHYNSSGKRCAGSVGFPDRTAAANRAAERKRTIRTVSARPDQHASGPSLQLSSDHPPLTDRTSRCVVCRFMVPVMTNERLAPHRILARGSGPTTGQPACRGSEQLAVPDRPLARQARAPESRRQRLFAGERVVPEANRDARRRVFEVAGDFGVPAVEALRVLKLLGEFVRGPHSSLPPGVERRLVAALEAHGHVRSSRRMFGLSGTRAGSAGDLMQQLPRSMPAFVDLLAAGEDPVVSEAEVLLRESIADGSLFYVPLKHSRALAAATRTVSGLASDDLPCPTGVGLQPLAAPTATGATWRLISWREEAEYLRLMSVDFTVHLTEDGSALEVLETAVEKLRCAPDDSFSDGSGALDGLGACLAGMLELVPVREPVSTRQNPTSTPSPATSEAKSRTDRGVRLIYPTRSALGSEGPPEEGGGARIGRWSVRGHWRRQWYRSRQTHERIWIEEHEAGASDASVAQLRKVFIIAPRSLRQG